MKKRTKLTIGGLALLAGTLLLSSCTASFCTPNDKAHIMYAFDYGVCDYSATAGEGAVQVFEGNTNVYYTLNVPTSSSSGIGKVSADAIKANVKLPSNNYYVKLDQLVLENALKKANESVDFATVTYDDVLFALDNYGYLKYAPSEGGKLWDGWDSLQEELKGMSQTAGSGIVLDDLPNNDYITLYKRDMNALINGYRSCLAISEDNYGNYGYANGAKYREDIAVKYHNLSAEDYRGRMSTTIESKSWGNAWKVNGKFTFFEGLLVYPIGWLTETFVKGFKNIGVMAGLAQLLAIFAITFIVRSLMLVVTIKSTAGNAKMQALQPEIAKIQNKYPNSNTSKAEKARMAQDMQALYKKNHVNPFITIIVLIVQFPVFICVWGALSGSAALTNGTFLGLTLSVTIKDALFNGAAWTAAGGYAAVTALFLFLLMAAAQTVSMLLPQWIQKKKAKQVAKLGKNPAQKQQSNRMKWFTYIMLALIIFMGFSLASAMGIYWFIGAIFSIIQTLVIQVITDRKAARK